MSSGVEIERRPAKLSFSLTCNLFSQYIKEKGFPADLGLEMTSRSLGNRETYRVPTTMSLLPGVEITSDDQIFMKDAISAPNAARSIAPSAETKVPEKDQLTIFYGGTVMVFDNFPAEKAANLMQLASKSACLAANPRSFPLMPENLAVVDRPTGPAPANSPANFPPPPQPNFSDLPIARKASLHRFLEKRKDRISAKSPYQIGSSEGLKQEDISQLWLGLAYQSSS